MGDASWIFPSKEHMSNIFVQYSTMDMAKSNSIMLTSLNAGSMHLEKIMLRGCRNVEKNFHLCYLSSNLLQRTKLVDSLDNGKEDLNPLVCIKLEDETYGLKFSISLDPSSCFLRDSTQTDGNFLIYESNGKMSALMMDIISIFLLFLLALILGICYFIYWIIQKRESLKILYNRMENGPI